MAAGCMIFLLFLMFSVNVSGSKLPINSDPTDFFTKVIEELSATELAGLPDMGWKPLDPFQMEYAHVWFTLLDPRTEVIYDLRLMGTVTGLSNFTVGGITVTEGDDVIWMKFNVTTGPISLKARYIFSSFEQDIPLYQGTFELAADSATRTEHVTVRTLRDKSYFVSASESDAVYSSVENYALNMSGLPENMTHLITDLSPSAVLSMVSAFYIYNEMYLFNDLIRHTDTPKLHLHSIKHKQTSMISTVFNTQRKSLEGGQDVKEFFENKVQELSSTELSGFPIAGWDPIDPIESFYLPAINIIVDHEDKIMFYLMGSLSGFSNFTSHNIDVMQNLDHSVTVKFNASTGPIHLRARYLATGRLNGSSTPIYEGSFELKVDSSTRSEHTEIGVGPDGSYFEKVFTSSVIYTSVENISLNIFDLPSDIVQLVNSVPPEKILTQISDAFYFYNHAFLFSDLIKYEAY